MYTFKLDEQLLGKAPQIALQTVPPASDAFHLLAQVEVILLPACTLPVGFVQRRFQLGILFFQLADRSQFLFYRVVSQPPTRGLSCSPVLA